MQPTLASQTSATKDTVLLQKLNVYGKLGKTRTLVTTGLFGQLLKVGNQGHIEDGMLFNHTKFISL